MNEPLLPAKPQFNPNVNMNYPHIQNNEPSFEANNNIPHSENLMAPQKVRHVFDCIPIGELAVPFIAPNVHPTREIEDIQSVLSDSKDSGFGCGDMCCMGASCVSIVGIYNLWKNTVLINSNQYGFIINSGKVVFLKPGWHFVGYPLMTDLTTRDINSELIQVNNLQIIRIRQDEVGIAYNNTTLEVLLPGTHLRTNGAYTFIRKQKIRDDLVEGPVKIKTVKTGTVCICYNNGVAEILTEGRYAINSNGFVIGGTLDITQQNLKFSKHKVLLEGGINMLIEGLLTYQVKDVGKLIKNVDINSLNRYLEDVMKADLTKVFSTIHLEQIASTTYNEIKKSDERAAETRLFIYESIMKMIKPQADQWGIHIINFQLESTQLADQKYSNDYETASLQIAKSKAELKAQEAQNVIRIQKAETEANVLKIQAEADRNIQLIRAKALADATIMQADAAAQAIMKEGEAKATAASMMKSEYGQELALLAEKSKIAEGLKIHTLVMGGTGNAAGKSMIDNVVPVLNL